MSFRHHKQSVPSSIEICCHSLYLQIDGKIFRWILLLVCQFLLIKKARYTILWSWLLSIYSQMVYYEPFKVTIDALELAEIIINILVRYHSLLYSIVINWSSFLYQKLVIVILFCWNKKKTLNYIYPKNWWSNRETQNNSMKAYLKAFVNYK